jgi:Nif-specific regulatory protein
MTMPWQEKPSVLHSVAELLSRQVTTDQLLKAMVDRVVEELRAERGTLYLVDAITGELCSRVAHLPEMKEIRLPPGKGVAGHVAETGETMILADAAADDHFFPGIDRTTGYTTRSMITVPVRDAGGATRGVLQVLNRREGQFSSEDAARMIDLAEQVAQALELTSMRPCGDRLKGVLVDGPFNHIVGESQGMAELYRRILAAAATDATVLVRGESGTGKTLVARAIHDNSERRSGPLIHVDCATLPAGLIESELFGHERGAFTGADRRVQGKCELADGGTLFLDEIGELPLQLQSKLLRFLQEREFERLGGRQTLHADARVISATNADLEAMVAEGRFRRDLYYRIKVVDLVVPPLRERGPRDIERLSEHFLDVYVRRHRRRVRGISHAAMTRLQAYAWPGNVRELEHCIESAVVLAGGDSIEDDHLALPRASRGGTIPPGAMLAPSGYAPGTPLSAVEQDHIQRTLTHCNGNRTEAAQLLGIGRNTLIRKLKELPPKG